ncbi:hypothetical protein EJ07DRAFT_110568 [Lizonia empirigonia]|nr:hypothetical protein EJ07DRAFT_110568 [Lizonia empirigonia]
MPIPSAVSLLMAPMHLLAYSTLLGTELYQSFVMTKVAYQALPRSAFTSLQKRVFPIYFRGQSSLLVFVALTIPPRPMSMFCSRNDWIPLAMAGGTAALNLLVYGPKTQKLMIERAHQVTRDSTRAGATEISAEMRHLNRSFSKAHAMSIHLNLMTIIATLYYGWRLSSKLSFETV